MTDMEGDDPCESNEGREVEGPCEKNESVEEEELTEDEDAKATFVSERETRS